MKRKCFLALIMLIAIFTLQAQNTDKTDDPVFVVVDEMPVYPGVQEALNKFIVDNVSYPDNAKKENIQGTVYVSFVVNEKGEVVNCKVERGVNPELNKEALRVINKLENWTPGKHNGKTVKVKFAFPIKFSLG